MRSVYKMRTVSPNVIEKRRKAIGLSVYALSQKAKVSRRTIDRYEAGELPSIENEELSKILEVLFPTKNERYLAKQQLQKFLIEAEKEVVHRRNERKEITRVRKTHRIVINLLLEPSTPLDKDPKAGLEYKEPRALIQVFEGKVLICSWNPNKGFTMFSEGKEVKGAQAKEALLQHCAKRKYSPQALLRYMRDELENDARFDSETYENGNRVFADTQHLEQIRLTVAMAGMYLKHKKFIEASDEQFGTKLLKIDKYIYRLINQPEDIRKLKMRIFKDIDALIEQFSS
jgi:transcriptional regulator with XRE-family HTH domain